MPNPDHLSSPEFCRELVAALRCGVQPEPTLICRDYAGGEGLLHFCVPARREHPWAGHALPARPSDEFRLDTIVIAWWRPGGIWSLWVGSWRTALREWAPASRLLAS